ncbi:MAG: glutamyl-tRNA reductase [bacterium]|nr:glutamyl-tRNA reductase [bacterium]
MEIIVIGLNHKTAPVDIREKFSFPESAINEALLALKGSAEIMENLILSTCNRVEIYALVNEAEAGIRSIEEFLSKSKKMGIEQFRPHVYILKGDDAVNHLFRVIASLDSMIVGEPQIMGQVKDAFEYALNVETNGIVFNTLFKKAAEVGKRARSETDIAKNAVSIGFAGVELAKKIFGDISGKTVLVIGAGEMSELTLKHLVGNGVSNVFITNRTFEKAEELAKAFNAKAIPFEESFKEMVNVDIVISSTGAPHCIITKDFVSKLIKDRKHKPIFFIDIAVPRDIEEEVNIIDNVYLYDIDDLKVVIESNLKERAKEIPKVEVIIEKEKHKFFAWFNSLEVVPTIVSFKDKVEDIRKSELEKIINRLGSVSEKDKDLIEALSVGIANKFMHLPIIQLKKATQEDSGYVYVDALRYLFGLENKE